MYLSVGLCYFIKHVHGYVGHFTATGLFGVPALLYSFIYKSSIKKFGKTIFLICGALCSIVLHF